MSVVLSKAETDLDAELQRLRAENELLKEKLTHKRSVRPSTHLSEYIATKLDSVGLSETNQQQYVRAATSAFVRFVADKKSHFWGEAEVEIGKRLVDSMLGSVVNERKNYRRD